MKRLACALSLAGATCALLVYPNNACAAPQRAPSNLKLSILTPELSAVADRMTVDVSFRGGAVDSVELYVDGKLAAKRQIGTAQSRGVISFSIDSLELTEGPHDVQVKAFSPDGKAATTTAKIHIPAFDLTAPVRISYPQNGIQVSGIVPVRVYLDQDIQRQKPYVTFFVDKELKVLRNYPPYEYSWDTTKYLNGWHIVEAWTQTADAISPTKARPIHVTVNNAGGETKKMDKIEDLGKPAKNHEPIALQGSKRSDPATAGKAINPDVTGNKSALGNPAARPQSDSTIRSNNPSLYGTVDTAKPNVATPGIVSNTAAKIGVPAPRLMGGAVSQPKDRIAIAKGAKSALPGLGHSDAIFPVVSPNREGGDGLIKVQPGETIGSISKARGIPIRDIVRLNNMRPGQKLHGSIIVPRAGTFDVAFDGDRIVFDVQPRIEAGIRLAPFRQIFEHTGGKLYWFGNVKTVKAVNSSREIELKIGDPNALVNNQAMSMERKPYIISGRTIVPLTFIRDSMSVKVSYDDKSGRLLIESIK